MPKISTRSLRSIARVSLLLIVAVAPAAVFADGGYFAQTKHGSTTDGVQRDPALPKGNCQQCHTGHGDTPQDFGLFTMNDNNLCFTCHSSESHSFPGQTAYASSGHAISAATQDQRPVGLCVQCHNPHGAGDNRGLYPKMAAKDEEQVCYTCHGNSGLRPSGAADIQTQSTKRYAHGEGSYERLHDDASEFANVGGNPNPLLSGASRHVECADCHNTHTGRTAPRPARSSNIGEVMLGSWGVRPIYGGSWFAPSSYVTERFQSTANENEAYLCFKCHSNYSFGNIPPFTADHVEETNTAMEFNPANASYHNVLGQPETSVPSEDYVTGTATPLAYVNGWTANAAMACTDCHAGDPSSGSVRGAHGSNFSFMLKKRYKAQAGAFDNTGRMGTQNDVCFDCHDWNTYGEGGVGANTNFRSSSANLHAMAGHAQAGCFQCHSTVPHGFKRKHMIVYVSDGAPYYQSDPTNYPLNKGGIEQYSLPNGGVYTANNCKAGCHSGHQQSTPVNPLP